MSLIRTERWLAIMLCLSLTGCSSVCHLVARTTRKEPGEFSFQHDRSRSVKTYRVWAEQALQDEWQQCPDLWDSAEYRAGFRDGFIDYVYAGGCGEPPPVPPREFWNVSLRSPEGHARAQQWFNGYRHGAGTARDGGYRQLAMLQSSYVGHASDESYEQAPFDSSWDSERLYDGPVLEELPLPDDEADAPDAEPLEHPLPERDPVELMEQPEPPPTPSEIDELGLGVKNDSPPQKIQTSTWRAAGQDAVRRVWSSEPRSEMFEW